MLGALQETHLKRRSLPTRLHSATTQPKNPSSFSTFRWFPFSKFLPVVMCAVGFSDNGVTSKYGALKVILFILIGMLTKLTERIWRPSLDASNENYVNLCACIYRFFWRHLSLLISSLFLLSPSDVLPLPPIYLHYGFSLSTNYRPSTPPGGIRSRAHLTQPFTVVL